MKYIFTLLIFLVSLSGVRAQYQFVSPLPGSQGLPLVHNIIIREGRELDPASIQPYLFNIYGSKSGFHTFKLVLCDDGKTINLNPEIPFELEEEVTVSVSGGLVTTGGNVIDGCTFSFTTYAVGNTEGEGEKEKILDDGTVGENEYPIEEDEGDLREMDGMFTITSNSNPSPGNIFFDCRPNIYIYSVYNSISVIDNNGDSVFQRTFNTFPYDFKLSDNGYLSTFQGNIDKFLVLDSNFAAIDTYSSVNGFEGNPHEFEMLENGYSFLIADEEQVLPVELNDTTFEERKVLGSVIQEFDAHHNILFEWRSFDHIGLEEARHVNFYSNLVDYIHTNAIELDTDGNIIVSHRNLDQVTKIDVNTGEFIWRLGGLYNEFTFTNDSNMFSHQHDCRRIANGNITLYDNGNYHVPVRSYAKEYHLDEANMTATLVWSYSHPDVDGHVAFYSSMGSVQRLPNGNTLVGWGYRSTTLMPNITEVDTANNIVWELKMAAGFNLIAYRAHKYNWSPCARPTYNLMKALNITNQSVRLSWAATSNPTQQYEVQYKKHVDSVWYDKKVVPWLHYLDLDSLDATTEYDWRIQSWCDTVAGESSHFTDIAHFNTLFPTGINEDGMNDYQLYPNPVGDIVNISCTFKVSKIRVLNLLGQEVKTFLFNEESTDQPIQISVLNLPPANYFVEVTGKETKRMRMMMVE